MNHSSFTPFDWICIGAWFHFKIFPLNWGSCLFPAIFVMKNSKWFISIKITFHITFIASFDADMLFILPRVKMHCLFFCSFICETLRFGITIQCQCNIVKILFNCLHFAIFLFPVIFAYFTVFLASSRSMGIIKVKYCGFFFLAGW